MERQSERPTTLEEITAEEFRRYDALRKAGGGQFRSDFVLGVLRATERNDPFSDGIGLLDTYNHSLQVATRAYRDGADEETVVMALLHDLFDVVSDNHDEVAAAFLSPFISQENHWIVRHHGVFQQYHMPNHPDVDRNSREQFRGHDHFEAAVRFCERWDHVSFDPASEMLPLSFFEPMVRRILDRPRSDRVGGETIARKMLG